jgi:hypothetical protein
LIDNMNLVRQSPPGFATVRHVLDDEEQVRQASFVLRAIALRRRKSQENERTTTGRSDTVQPGRSKIAANDRRLP